MRRYRFRLEQVARVRRMQEERSRAELLAARQRLIQAGADLSQSVENYQTRSPRGARASGLRFRAERDQDELLVLAITAARVAEANARLLVGRRVDEWIAAAREVSTVERLDERARADHEEEEGRAAQRELDDLVTSRWAVRPEGDR